MAVDGKPLWAVRLRDERRQRGWSQAEMAKQLLNAAATIGVTLVGHESLIRRIKDWEAGRHKPKAPYPMLYAYALGLSKDFLAEDSKTQASTNAADVDVTILVDSAAQEMMEFGLWAETTNVGDGTLAYFDEQTRRIARAYLRETPVPCLQQASSLARRVFHLLRDGHQHHRQTTDLYLIAGKLCALMSWISSDLGQVAAADAHARTGRIVADQVGHPALTALLVSAQSKLAFWEGQYKKAAQLARYGYDVAPFNSAKILLACQEADAWQAQGAVAYAQAALDRAGRAREHLSSDNPLGGPFDCGLARQSNYTMGVHIRARDTEKALKAANEAKQEWRSGDTCAYGTWAQVHIGMAIAHVMTGEVDGAAEALHPVLNLSVDHRLTPLTARLARELTPLLESDRLRRVRPALALSEQVKEYCSGSVAMMRQIIKGQEDSW